MLVNRRGQARNRVDGTFRAIEAPREGCGSESRVTSARRSVRAASSAASTGFDHRSGTDASRETLRDSDRAGRSTQTEDRRSSRRMLRWRLRTTALARVGSWKKRLATDDTQEDVDERVEFDGFDDAYLLATSGNVGTVEAHLLSPAAVGLGQVALRLVDNVDHRARLDGRGLDGIGTGASRDG